jgi:hypothetical protein
MNKHSTFVVVAGGRAAARLAANGLASRDIACIPAAAGGPKGLSLLPFDRLLHREWLEDAHDVQLIGASIGAWRAAALAQADALGALDRLQHAYIHEQRYSPRPSPDEVATRCRAIVESMLGSEGLRIRPGVGLQVVTARARGILGTRESKSAFLRAILGNALSRKRLGRFFERVIFHAGEAPFLAESFDACGLHQVPIDSTNARDALLASGTIPILCSPVRDIGGAPPGRYWDGALVDYHMMLPYAVAPGRVVLYPHFNDYVTPGWLDKHLPWRRAPRGHRWLDDVLLIAPSPSFIATLPNGKLPDRRDFYRYGSDHAGRERAWSRAAAECERFATDAFEWLRRPDPAVIRPL